MGRFLSAAKTTEFLPHRHSINLTDNEKDEYYKSCGKSCGAVLTIPGDI